MFTFVLCTTGTSQVSMIGKFLKEKSIQICIYFVLLQTKVLSVSKKGIHRNFHTKLFFNHFLKFSLENSLKAEKKPQTTREKKLNTHEIVKSF